MNTVKISSMNILSTYVVQCAVSTVAMMMSMSMVCASHVDVNWADIDVSSTIVMVMVTRTVMARTTVCNKIERVNDVIVMMTVWVTIVAKWAMVLSMGGHETYLSYHCMIFKSLFIITIDYITISYLQRVP